jgi:nucleotide-binding universal stress UspA family protein
MSTNQHSDRVVVGVDGSAASVGALRYAARIADALDAPLEAVITWDIARYVYLERDRVQHTGQAASERLRTAVQEAFGDESPEGLLQTTLEGDAAHTLIQLSATCGMLVLGSRGLGGFRGLLLGSVSRVCAEHAHCPVLVVRRSVSRSE